MGEEAPVQPVAARRVREESVVVVEPLDCLDGSARSVASLLSIEVYFDDLSARARVPSLSPSYLDPSSSLLRGDPPASLSRLMFRTAPVGEPEGAPYDVSICCCS